MAGQVRHEWYQTDAEVVVEVFRRRATADTCRVRFQPRAVSVSVRDDDGQSEPETWRRVFETGLHADVDVDRCTVVYRQPKIELKLRKAAGGHWPRLHAAPAAAVGAVGDNAGQAASSRAYPSSSTHGDKNWDKIEKEALEEEKKEELSGDAAVNRLFQQIYADADEDTRRAMVKSFTESKGTVLSTNWGEVKQKEVDAKPPDSMEWKKYD